MRRTILTLSVLLGALVAGRTALAAGGATTNVAGAFAQTTVFQSAGVVWTFTTSNLSPGADTVIHVQDDADTQGGYIAGNDDFNGLASSVTVPRVTFDRTLRVIVRAYSDTTSGTGTLTATPSVGSPFTISISFGGSRFLVTGALGPGTHVTTAEMLPVLNGASDTVLLVVGGTADHAIAYDDDDGVGFMSWVHLPEACLAPCYLIVANYTQPVSTLTTRIYWDDDADTNDNDGDGLGASLEASIGTHDNMADSDSDGIEDGLELFGLDGDTPVKFPTWGADPTVKDLFIEVDWQPCLDPDTTKCPNQEIYRIGVNNTPQATLAAQVAAAYSPVQVHIDMVGPNLDPATALQWGDWGGSEQLASETPGACDGFTPARKGYFHHVVTGIASVSGLVVDCSWAPPYSTGFAHEVGHSLGLGHGGRPTVTDINYKFNYPSQMNYMYYDLQFSHGTLPTLNPAALNEAQGLGTTDPRIVATVSSRLCPVGTCFSGQAIDWDRDGVYSPSTTTVRGVAMDHASSYGRAVLAPNTLTDPSMAWVSVGGAQGNQLWIVGRGPSNQLRYIREPRANLLGGCTTTFTSLTDTASDCGSLGSVTVEENTSMTTSFGIGVAEVIGATTPTLVAVWQPLTGNLRARTITISPTTNAVTFGSSAALPGTISTTSDVTALSISTGVVKAWAKSGTRLKEWTYQNGTWSNPVDQHWNDTNTTLVNVSGGIGATRGFQDGGANASTYAAIPTGTSGTIEFARQEATGRWTKIAAWGDMTMQPTVVGRPGLAYAHTLGAAANVGRFYMALTPPSGCTSPGPDYPFGNTAVLNQPCYSKIMKTEGNLSTGTTRRLVWIRPTMLYGPADGPSAAPFIALGGISLVDDPSRDTNLRAVKVYQTGELEFSPLADGAVNVSLGDLNDFLYLEGALRASLGKEPLPLP